MTETPHTSCAPTAADAAQNAEPHERRSWRSHVESAVEALDSLSGLPTNHLSHAALSYGIPDLDRITLGLAPGSLTVIAGRPWTGASKLAQHIILETARKTGTPVTMATLLRNGSSIASSLIHQAALIEQSRLLTGQLYDSDWSRVTDFIKGSLTTADLQLIDTPGLALAELARACEQRHGGHANTGLIVVDSLPMLLANTRHATGRHDVEVVSPLKNLARRLNCAVVTTTDCDRAVDSRPNKRPLLRDVMPLTQPVVEFADTTLMLYREERPHEHGRPADGIELLEVEVASGSAPRYTAHLRLDLRTGSVAPQ